MCPDAQRLHSSSFLGIPYGILSMNLKKELLWSLRIVGNPKIAKLSGLRLPDSMA